MRLSTTTDCLEKNFGFKKTIDILADAGFDAIDFSTFSKEEFYTDVHSKEFYSEIRKYAENTGLVFNQAHGPDGSSFADEERTKARFKEIVCSMKNASYLGAETIIIHPCQHMDFYQPKNAEKLFEYNMNFYKQLIPYCEEYEIKVALENMWQYPGMISHSTCSRPDEFIKYVDELNNDCMVACLDIGHAVLVREQPDEFIRKLGSKRLKCIHVHDVDGTNDLHTLPFFGITDWNSVISALKEISYSGDLTFEADNFMKQKPKELLPACAKFMASTGRYLVKIFDEMK